MTLKEQILELLGSVKRPGMDALLDYIKSSNYFQAKCNNHHFTEKGGLAQHTMEVYTYMKDHNESGLDKDSIILTAFCHDLGKTSKARRTYGKIRHDIRSLKVLQACGVELSDDERKAVLNHTPGKTYRITTFLTCPLYALLVKGDCLSAATWQHEHPEEVAAKKARRAARKARWASKAPYARGR